MTKIEPERYFRRGLGAIGAGKPDVALACFREAIAAEKQSGALRPRMRYLSYYGLSMALTHGATHECIRVCEEAASRDDFDPSLLANLGRVYLMAGKRTRALQTFARGLRLDPQNRDLLELVSKVDRRARPAVPALGRDHVVNRSLGRLRASLFPARTRQTPA